MWWLHTLRNHIEVIRAEEAARRNASTEATTQPNKVEKEGNATAPPSRRGRKFWRMR